MFSRPYILGRAEVTPLPSPALTEPLILKKDGVESKTFVDGEDEADDASAFVRELMFIFITMTM
jgi:hypothetical protein